jgi:hypothetical protein
MMSAQIPPMYRTHGSQQPGWLLLLSRSKPPLSCHSMRGVERRYHDDSQHLRRDVELQPTDAFEAPARESSNLIGRRFGSS